MKDEKNRILSQKETSERRPRLLSTEIRSHGCVRFAVLLSILLWTTLVIFTSCSGSMNYYIFDQATYKGSTGKIHTQAPLHIDRIDGMTFEELNYRYDIGFTSGGHVDAFNLTPGEHIIHVKGGTIGVHGYTNVTTISDLYLAFRIIIEPQHDYVITYENIGNSRVRAYIYDKISDKEVGTLVDWETGITQTTANPPKKDLSSVSLRSSYQAISKNEVISMLKKYDFHDEFANKTGSGIYHQYELKIIQGDKVIIDKTTGLMWNQSNSYVIHRYWIRELNLESVQNWIEEFNTRGYAGFSDWRLPTLEEAASLIEYKGNDNGSFFDPLFSLSVEREPNDMVLKGANLDYIICTGDTRSDSIIWNVRLGEGRVCWKKQYYTTVLPVRSMK